MDLDALYTPNTPETFGGDPLLEGFNKDKSPFQNPSSGGYPEEKQLSEENVGENGTSGIDKNFLSPDPNNPISLDGDDAGDGSDTKKLDNSSENDPLTKEPLDGDVSSLKHEAQGDPLIDPKSSSTPDKELGDGETVDDEDKKDSDIDATKDNTEEPNNLTSLEDDGDIEDDTEITDENQEDTEASTDTEDDAEDDTEITDENQEDTEASTDTEDDAEDDTEITDETEEDAGDASFNPDLLKLQPKFDFDRGLFKVDATGQVVIDFLFDGGFFKSQMAIVSKKGMENFEYGSEEFIKEVTRRAMSNSELGHIVLDDKTDKAKFTGKLGEGNWNEGDYQSARTFTMTPGDEFFVMLIPNGTVQEVHDNPGIGGAKRPLLSLATANPNDAYHVGQIADITGDGSAFSFEDLRVDFTTDKDYNDIIFQVRGATGKAALMDEVVDPAKDWRNTDMGQALIEYVKAYITPESPTEGEDAIADELDEPIDESSDSVDVPTDEATEDETEAVDETSDESDETEAVDETGDESDETEAVDETGDESDETEVVDETGDESDETEVVDETSDESDDDTDIVEDATAQSDDTAVVDETSDESDETEAVDETSDESDETEAVDETSNESDDDTDIVEDATAQSDDTEVVDETGDESDDTDIVGDATAQSDDTAVVDETSDESDDTDSVEDATAQSDDTAVVDDSTDESDRTEDAIASGIASPTANDTSEPSEQNQIATELPQTEPSENRDPIAANTQSSDTQTSNTPGESEEKPDVATSNNTNDSTNDPQAETTVPQQTAIAPSPTPPAPAPVEPPVRLKFPDKNQPQIIVIDSGFSRNNPDIDESKITWGRDYIDNDADPTLQAGEGNEHGTHILGILAAKQDNSIGIDGINPQAPILASRAIGSGKWAEALKDGVDAAKASGQPNAVVNLSFDLTQVNPDGSVTTRYEFTPKEREALEYARQNNVLIVVAAGNNASIMSVLGQASQEFDNIITVGAAEQVDPTVSAAKGVDRANYSNKGRGLDLMAIGGTPEKPVLSTVGDGVGTMAGTSVATAKVTGAASLVWAANPKLSYRQVIDILKSTATDLKTPNWDRDTGAGLLNIKAAVHLAKATEPEEYNPAPFRIPTTWSLEGKVTARERAVNSKSIYLSTDLGEIVQFDLGTGQKRHIYQGEAFTDLAVAPNGKLYGSTFNHLYEINTSTGDETYIGRFGGPNINSLTFSPDGRLYGAEEKSGDVYEISPQTARLTYIGNLGGPSSGDMVFDGASQFFATVGSPSMERDRLVAFDLNTRSARTITELSNDQFYGLAMHNGQLIGYTARKQEIALDPLTGQIDSISVVPVSGAIWGAAQNYTNVSYNPSPSSDWQRAMEREYQDMGWLLGNPTGPYANASRSPQGTEGKWRAYENGTIHWTPQHGAVAVWLDLQREYNEHGGSGGWLGFPTQREHDWKGGKRTLFEGGYIYWDGQRAKAYRHGELPTPDWQQAMEREYQDMGWLLGKPTGPYANASRSPQGTEGKWRAYENGTIHWTPQHGAVAVWLDLQREYNEQGGSSGWLGFPTQRERDWEGGKRTEFEGGFIYWDGQRATAYRNGEFVITKEHLHKFAQVAAKSPDIGGAIGPVTHNGDGVLQQNFQYGYIIWNGQQITVYDTSAVSQESGTENTPISQNQPFRDYVFSSREIDLRTSPTSSNHARSGIFAQPGLELAFEGWTYGETLTDLKTGEPNAIWYKFIDTEGTGQTFWVPSAWMGGFPPGNPPLVPPGGNSGSSGSGGSANSSSIDNFINWAMAQTSTITRHDRLTLGTWSDGECVTLIARYIQDVFMNPSDRSQPEQAYNHGYGTASTVSNLPYFGGYTTRAGLSSNPPRRGAVISFMGAGFDANYGHVGIVTRYDAATNRIYYIDIGKSQGGVVVGEKSISATNAAIQGWTNPLNAYSGAGNSSGGNSSSNYNGGSNGPPFGSNRPIITDRSDEYGFGQLTHSMNFRTYPWINDSTWIQTLASGTTVTLLEKVTTNDSTLSPPTWYKVKLKDGREGYVWADWIKKVSAKGNLPGGFSSGGTNYNQTQNPPASRKPESKNEQKIHELRDEIKEAAREFDVSAELIAAILYDELERRNKQDWRDLNVFAKDRGSRSRKNSFFIPTGEDDTEDVKAEQNPDNANEKSSLGVAQATPQRLAEALGLSKPDANVVKILLDEKKSPEVVATIVRDTIDYWRKDGYDIKNNSSVLATLYSIGRTGTKGTNPDPKANERGEEIAGDMQRMGEIMNYTGPVKLIP